MKLGYIYTTTADGYNDNKVRINSGDWCSVVEDERSIWLKYSSNSESVAMTFVKEGLVLAVSRIIGGNRADNNVTTWVFVPSGININGSQLKQVIEAVKEINRLGTKSVTAEHFANSEVLNADYPEKGSPILCNPSAGKELAGRYPTIDYSLNEILARPYQEYYTKYKYVFLLNGKSDIKEGLVDLSDKELIERICVLQPSTSSIQKALGSTTVTIRLADGRVFNAPIMAEKGKMISLIAEKTGCIPMHLTGRARGDEEEVEIFANANQWRRVISNNLFRVEDSKTCKAIPSTSVKIEVIDSQYDKRDNSFPEDKMGSVKVRVSANGYETAEGNANLSRGVTTIRLNKALEQATYNCSNGDGGDVKVTISGPGAKSKTPIRGYQVVGQRLQFNSSSGRFAWLEFCYGIGAAVLLAVICWGCVKFFGDNSPESTVVATPPSNPHSDTPSTTPVPPDSKPGDNASTPQFTTDKALEYLDNATGQWTRDELEKYPDLKGLFDELNTYDFKKILVRENVLGRSKNYQEIRKVIILNGNKSFQGKFCGEKDFTITVSNYIKKLKPTVEQPLNSTGNNGGSSDVSETDSERENPFDKP